MELIDDQDSSLLSSRVSNIRFYLETKRYLKYLCVLCLFIFCLCVSILVVEVNHEHDSPVRESEWWKEQFWQIFHRLEWGQDDREPDSESQFYRRIIAAAYCSNGEKDRAAQYGY